MNENSRVAKLKTIFFLLIITTFVFSTVSFAFSQTQSATLSKSVDKNKWITFSSPNKTFAVELPELPEQGVMIANPNRQAETRVELYIFKCTKSLNYYVLSSNTRPDYDKLAIWEVDISACKRNKEDVEYDLVALPVMTLGDDYTVVSDKAVKINNIPGRDLVYKKGDVVLRTLYIDAGNRLFVMSHSRKNGNLGRKRGYLVLSN